MKERQQQPGIEELGDRSPETLDDRLDRVTQLVGQIERDVHQHRIAE
jgi:hypothetical protein